MANEINIDLGKRRSLKANIGVPGYLGKGDTGTGIESITYKGEDESGGNMYTVLLTDGTSYDITAPKGAAGADGITPTIGDNGNWYLGETDTGKPSRGETGPAGADGRDGADGQPGENGADGYSPTANVTQNDNGATITITDKNGTTTATVTNGKDGADGNPGADGSPGKDGTDGKSAYQYAVEGGYTGTEAEFAKKLASEALIVTITDNNGTLSADKSYIDILNAINAGTTVLVDYDGISLPLIGIAGSLFFGLFTCDTDNGPATVGSNLIEITQNGEVNDLSAYIEKLPNPNALTFTGAVTGSYDGSAPLSVNIPSAVTDAHINSLIDTKLGVIENGSY